MVFFSLGRIFLRIWPACSWPKTYIGERIHTSVDRGRGSRKLFDIENTRCWYFVNMFSHRMREEDLREVWSESQAEVSSKRIILFYHKRIDLCDIDSCGIDFCENNFCGFKSARICAAKFLQDQTCFFGITGGTKGRFEQKSQENYI